jgi:aspartyl-tRNA(Asn)/glutamyl-tRNA(Gln) amidotransferase subunit C
MSIANTDVERVASLARLTFKKVQTQEFAEELRQIVAYIEKLNELDTEGVEPTSHVIDLKNVFRHDSIEEWLNAEGAIENAPSSKRGYFSVPKVIG